MFRDLQIIWPDELRGPLGLSNGLEEIFKQEWEGHNDVECSSQQDNSFKWCCRPVDHSGPHIWIGLQPYRVDDLWT